MLDDEIFRSELMSMPESVIGTALDVEDIKAGRLDAILRNISFNMESVIGCETILKSIYGGERMISDKTLFEIRATMFRSYDEGHIVPVLYGLMLNPRRIEKLIIDPDDYVEYNGTSIRLKVLVKHVVGTTQCGKRLNVEFNINHPTGLMVPIANVVSDVIGGIRVEGLRELMFFNNSDRCVYYLVRNPGIVLIRVDNMGAVKALYDHINHYTAIVDCEFAKKWLNEGSCMGVININGTQYILYDDSLKTSAVFHDNTEAIKKLIVWLKDQHCPYTIDDLYQVYRKSIDGNITLSERAFNKLLSSNAVDITYNSKQETHERNAIEGGETLVKSCFKVSNAVCYYVYNGIIPEGTRDPWSRKKK